MSDWTDTELHKLVMDLRVATGNPADIHRMFFEILKPWFEKHNVELSAERSLRLTAQDNAQLWHEEMIKTDKKLNAANDEFLNLKKMLEVGLQDDRNLKQ